MITKKIAEGNQMKVKIIKKDNISVLKNTPYFHKDDKNKTLDSKAKAVENILGWVSELRQKKKFELNRTQILLSNFR